MCLRSSHNVGVWRLICCVHTRARAHTLANHTHTHTLTCTNTRRHTLALAHTQTHSLTKTDTHTQQTPTRTTTAPTRCWAAIHADRVREKIARARSRAHTHARTSTHTPELLAIDKETDGRTLPFRRARGLRVWFVSHTRTHTHALRRHTTDNVRALGESAQSPHREKARATCVLVSAQRRRMQSARQQNGAIQCVPHTRARL